MKRLLLPALVLCMGLLLAWQGTRMAALEKEVSALQTIRSLKPSIPVEKEISLGSLPVRVAALEQALNEFAHLRDQIMQASPSPDNLSRLINSFMDVSLSDEQRMRALKALQDHRHMPDEVVMGAVSWYLETTNITLKPAILRQLDNLSNEVMKDPLLAQLKIEPNSELREQLLDVVEAFAGDAEADKLLWALALNDPENRVRIRALNTFQNRMTPERIQVFRDRALAANLTLEERLFAAQQLRRFKANVPEVWTEIGAMAQVASDPVTRARLFESFQGINQPELTPVIVSGLQDANPLVRERAARSLSALPPDPNTQKWLQYLINSDPDPRVRREAFQALETIQQKLH